MSRGLQQERTSFLLSGSPAAIDLLVRQLNAAGDKNDLVSVREMVKDMNEIDRVVRSKGFPFSPDAKLSFDLELEWNSLELDDAVQERMKKIRATYESFKLRLRPVCPLKRGWKFHMMNPWSSDPKKRGLVLWTFLSIIHDLALEGRLRQVRECVVCGRWFFAYGADSRFRFDSDRCREKYWRTTPEGRVKRAAYQRKFRAGLKRRDRENLKVPPERQRKRK